MAMSNPNYPAKSGKTSGGGRGNTPKTPSSGKPNSGGNGSGNTPKK